jgi:hypothetical protein
MISGRRHRAAKKTSDVLWATVIILGCGLLVAQLIVTHNLKAPLKTNSHALAQTAQFDIYVPPSPLFGARPGPVRMLRDQEVTAFSASYKVGPISQLYEQSMTAYDDGNGPIIPYSSGDCLLSAARLKDENDTLQATSFFDPKPASIVNDCRQIGTAKNGASILVTKQRYAEKCQFGCQAVAQFNGTFIGIEFSEYITPQHIVDYFNDLEKVAPEQVKFSGGTNNLLLFPNLY